MLTADKKAHAAVRRNVAGSAGITLDCSTASLAHAKFPPPREQANGGPLGSQIRARGFLQSKNVHRYRAKFLFMGKQRGAIERTNDHGILRFAPAGERRRLIAPMISKDQINGCACGETIKRRRNQAVVVTETHSTGKPKVNITSPTRATGYDGGEQRAGCPHMDGNGPTIEGSLKRDCVAPSTSQDLVGESSNITNAISIELRVGGELTSDGSATATNVQLKSLQSGGGGQGRILTITVARALAELERVKGIFVIAFGTTA